MLPLFSVTSILEFRTICSLNSTPTRRSSVVPTEGKGAPGPEVLQRGLRAVADERVGWRRLRRRYDGPGQGSQKGRGYYKA